jgi:hypothetical protein
MEQIDNVYMYGKNLIPALAASTVGIVVMTLTCFALLRKPLLNSYKSGDNVVGRPVQINSGNRFLRITLAALLILGCIALIVLDLDSGLWGAPVKGIWDVLRKQCSLMEAFALSYYHVAVGR